MISIGSCDLCGEFCASEEDDYRTATRHNRIAERRWDCEERHVGPWHGPRGEPRRRCAWCRELAAYLAVDNPLDHSDCARCQAVLPMHARRAPTGWRDRTPAPSSAGTDLEQRLSEGIESTEPADRERAERALRTYLGRRSVRVRWHDSPAELGRVFDHAARAAGLEQEPPADQVQPWSLWAMAPRALRRRLTDREIFRSDRGVEAVLARINGRADRIAASVSGIAAPAGGEFWLPTSDSGQWDTWSRFLDAVDVVTGSPIPDGGFLRLMAELRASCGLVLAFHGLIHLLERPLAIRLDDQGRLHAEEGPALAYADGTEAWALHGIVVPQHVVREPDRIDIGEIDAQRNAEVRRVMVERFGAERLVRDGGAELVHEDATGRLWRRPLPGAQWGEQPIVMVEVINSTPEPDGSRKTYFLRVPPDTRTARAAVAWTFGMSESAYQPSRET